MRGTPSPHSLSLPARDIARRARARRQLATRHHPRKHCGLFFVHAWWWSSVQNTFRVELVAHTHRSSPAIPPMEPIWYVTSPHPNHLPPKTKKAHSQYRHFRKASEDVCRKAADFVPVDRPEVAAHERKRGREREERHHPPSLCRN